MKINLLKEETAKYSTADKIRKFNRYLILTVGSLFMLLAVVVGAQYAYYQVTLMGEMKKTADLEKQYNQRSLEVVTYLRVKDVLGKASEIINTRTKYQQLLSEANSLFPQGVAMASATFTDKVTLNVTAKANGIQDYVKFLDNLKGASTDSNFSFKTIIQNGLNRGDNGNYIFALGLTSKQ